ncbi:stalk domain-containing protein [Neomoorella thermoacetica]|uniref:stalk domain-containing protein n=1 Tax=Neomoorella thermoacetica TaxID=1525 RepID=UPI0008FAC0EF|nr:copper amine oxidase N-terminal domain-containing protein [Moorella thermoacetica]OIQ12255.1 hypothetical protein MOOTH_08920 [Moorella thermoacetica]
MLKTKQKWLSIVLAVMFLFTLVPFGAHPALANTQYQTITAIPSFDPGKDEAKNLELATVYIKIDPALANANGEAIVEVVDSEGSKLDIQSATLTGMSNYSVANTNVTYTPGDTFAKLSVTSGVYNAKSEFTLNLTVDAKDAAAGDVQVRFSNASGILENGSVVAAVAKGAGVEVSVDKVVAIGDGGGDVTFTVQENTLYGLDNTVGKNTVKFKLPNGFTWKDGSGSVKLLSGKLVDVNGNSLSETDAFKVITDERELKVEVQKAFKYATGSPKIRLEVSGTIKVDTSVAKYGDVTVTLGGESTVTPSDVVVANYGDYSASLKSIEVKSIQPGQFDQEIGKFAIDEALPGSLVAGRTIELTLPENVKWEQYPKFSSGDSKNVGSFAIDNFEAVGTSGRTIKAKITQATSGNKPTEIVFKDGKVTAAADFTGKIELTVGGSAGVTGTVVVAEAKAPVTASASSTPSVIIGERGQAAGDLMITESAAEVFQKDLDASDMLIDGASKKLDADPGYLVIKAPEGVRFDVTPTVTVSDGDLEIDTVQRYSDDNMVKIKIKSQSAKASTIKISNIKLTVDRTVPVGDLELKIGGTALVENSMDGFFPDNEWIAKASVAKVITPAPSETQATVKFVIGDKNYNVNGVDYTMDVAPYVDSGRTFVPIRYLANALGVNPENIYFNNDTQSAILLKDGTSVEFTIGSNIMKLGSVSIPMDVAAQVVNGRIMLPARYVANAFGYYNVGYDEATQTVTISK